MQNPTDEELTRLGEEFKLHPLAIEDASREHQRPKVEGYENFYFVVFYAIDFNTEKQALEAREVDMFLSEKYLITVHTKPMQELDEVEQRWIRNVKQHEWGVGVLLYSMLDTLVDSYFPIIDNLVDQAEELEDSLFKGAIRQNTFAQQLLELKKQFLMS